jgi:hypothetical protein
MTTLSQITGQFMVARASWLIDCGKGLVDEEDVHTLMNVTGLKFKVEIPIH